MICNLPVPLALGETPLTGRYDFFKVDLQPTEQCKSVRNYYLKTSFFISKFLQLVENIAK